RRTERSEDRAAGQGKNPDHHARRRIVKQEYSWDRFPPAHRQTLLAVFAEAAGKTVPLDAPLLPAGKLDFTINDLLDFEFVLGNYSAEAERRAGRLLASAEAIMAACAVLRERLAL
ncbi:MAG TPA: hypothetical protein VIF12_02235, partial [Micavibrio sp.]